MLVAAGSHGQGIMLHVAGGSPGAGRRSHAEHSCSDPNHSSRLGPPAPQSMQDPHLPRCSCTQIVAVDRGNPALLGAQEGPPAFAGSEVPAPLPDFSPLSVPHQLRSWSKVRAKPRHHEWQ